MAGNTCAAPCCSQAAAQVYSHYSHGASELMHQLKNSIQCVILAYALIGSTCGLDCILLGSGCNSSGTTCSSQLNTWLEAVCAVLLPYAAVTGTFKRLRYP